MKCLKSSWLGTGLVFVLLANFAIAQNNDDDRKGRGRDRGERGQNSKQSEQSPQGRRQAVSPGENRARDNRSRPAHVDYQPAEKGQKDRNGDNDAPGNDRKERTSPKDY